MEEESPAPKAVQSRCVCAAMNIEPSLFLQCDNAAVRFLYKDLYLKRKLCTNPPRFAYVLSMV